MHIFKVVVHETVRKSTHIQAETKEEAAELVFQEPPDLEELVDLTVVSVELADPPSPE